MQDKNNKQTNKTLILSIGKCCFFIQRCTSYNALDTELPDSLDEMWNDLNFGFKAVQQSRSLCTSSFVVILFTVVSDGKPSA